ncbi:MAG: hypothetical protein R3F20_09870 [Planctomycetota bacterium]
MESHANCPVCTSKITLHSDDVGNKVECGHCHSIHRVTDGPGLKVLIEALEFEPVAAARPNPEVAAGPAPIKIVSRREKMREARAEALSSGGGRRATTSRSRR